MFPLPTSLTRVTGFFATSAVGALVARFARTRVRTPGGAGEAGEQGARAGVDASARRGSSREIIAASGVVMRRARVGRLRLPREVSDLTPQDEPALGAVNEFADRLADLPVSAWIDAGESVIAASATAASHSTSYAILEATINDRNLAVVAWYVRDAVETSAFYASQSMTRWTSRDRRAFAAAHGAAEETALALLVRAYLPDPEFATLTATFDGLARASLLSAPVWTDGHHIWGV